jgi:hypothetical protein
MYNVRVVHTGTLATFPIFIYYFAVNKRKETIRVPLKVRNKKVHSLCPSRSFTAVIK